MEAQILELIQTFLHLNQIFVYLVLFFGAFFDAVIGFNLFVYGEIFFLAGGILAGFGDLNIHLVFFLSVFGVILGDNFSYYIGKRFGKRLFKKHKKFFTLRLYSKGKKIFSKYGDKTVFLARIFGAFSWVTPFLAGIFKINYRRFFIYDFLGSVIGIGQFILIGYYLGYNYESVINLINNYFVILLIIVVGIGLLIYAIKKTRLKFILIDSKRKFIKFIIKYLAFYIIIVSVFYLFLAYCLFFIFIPQENKNYNNDIYKINHKIEKIVSDYNLNITEDSTSIIPAQKANVIYIGDNLEKEMNKIGWVKNENFGENSMGLFRYVYLILKKTSPVSNQYLFGKKQDFAFQNEDATITNRNHIRFWDVGFSGNTKKKVYIGGVSLDTGATIKFYKYLFVPFHKVDHNIDKARNLLLKSFLNNNKSLDYVLVASPYKVDNNSTDNKILIIKEK